MRQTLVEVVVSIRSIFFDGPFEMKQCFVVLSQLEVGLASVTIILLNFVLFLRLHHSDRSIPLVVLCPLFLELDSH